MTVVNVLDVTGHVHVDGRPVKQGYGVRFESEEHKVSVCESCGVRRELLTRTEIRVFVIRRDQRGEWVKSYELPRSVRVQGVPDGGGYLEYEDGEGTISSSRPA